MGLRDLVFKGVGIADSFTADLQKSVSIRRWQGVLTPSGKPDYAVAITPSGIVEEGTIIRRSTSGDVITAKGSVMFPRQLSSLTVAPPYVRRNPIDPRDEVTLPSGIVGFVVDIDEAPVDRVTGKTYYLQIFVG